MSEKIKLRIETGIISFVIALLVVFGSGLVGNQLAKLGAIGITRYPNSGIAARGLHISNSVANSVTDNTLTVTGTSTFGSLSSSGTLGVTGTSTFDSTMRVTGRVSVGTTTASTNTSLYIGGTTTIVSIAYTPAASSTACVVGSLAFDANRFYWCASSNTWKMATGTDFWP